MTSFLNVQVHLNDVVGEMIWDQRLLLELFSMLVEASVSTSDFAKDVASECSGSAAEQRIPKFLRDLADAIDEVEL